MKLNLATICLSLTASVLALVACNKEQPSANPTPDAHADTAHDDHAHDDHVHGPNGEHLEQMAGHGGPVIELGSATIGAFNAVATRDQAQIVAGKDAPIDVTVTPLAGGSAKATAVRFWIGTEDAKGSVKAKADIENPAEPNRWHTHAEIPNPIPDGAKLWVEIEDDQGARTAGSFDLKS